MTDLSERAKWLIEHPLSKIIYGGRFHLAQAARGSGFPNEHSREVILRLSGSIVDVAKSEARISKADDRITLTTAWCCERWCSCFLLVKSLYARGGGDFQLLEVLPSTGNFHWPATVPDPKSNADLLVTQTNNIYPWLVMAAVLHEVGHAVNAKNSVAGPLLELACDRFAALYLLGTEDFDIRDVRMLALAIWLCCLSSESLGPHSFRGIDHPNPIQRVRTFLNEFVPSETEVGKRIWLMCASHAMRLARIHDRPALDDEVLTRSQANLDEILNDLALCR